MDVNLNLTMNIGGSSMNISGARHTTEKRKNSRQRQAGQPPKPAASNSSQVGQAPGGEGDSAPTSCYRMFHVKECCVYSIEDEDF